MSLKGEPELTPVSEVARLLVEWDRLSRRGGQALSRRRRDGRGRGGWLRGSRAASAGAMDRHRMAEIVLRNAHIVVRDAVVAGSLVVRDGAIAAVEAGAGRVGIDLEGDLLIPGLVELHTDNLEKHYSPRIGVVWDAVSAAIAHDVQCAGSGITTVFDSLVLGAAPGWEVRDDWLRPMLEGLARARAAGMLKGDHRLHLRCEVT